MRYDYDYVIIGAGMAANSAARGIRERDPSGSILLLEAGTNEPYERPPLSKGLWTDSATDVDSIFLSTAQDTGATILTNSQVTQLKPSDHIVLTADGDLVHYRRLLLATGGTPRKFPGQVSAEVIYFRTLDDFKQLRSLAGAGRHIAVVGGGFIGTELACALALNDTQVTLITPDSEIGVRNYPAGIRARLTRAFQDHGVHLMTGQLVESITEEEEGSPAATLTLEDGSIIKADAVVAGLGILPNSELASLAGLSTERDGVMVDEFLRTSDPDIFAAGDIALFHDPILGLRRVEHVDQAETSGTYAGRNMVEADEPFAHTPLFYSDLFDDGFEAVGLLDTSLDIVEDWAEGQANAKGVVYYLDNGAVKGILLWNVWDSVDRARAALKEFAKPGAVTDAAQLRGRIATN